VLVTLPAMKRARVGEAALPLVVRCLLPVVVVCCGMLWCVRLQWMRQLSGTHRRRCARRRCERGG
jgi:hypothetical protein